MVTVTDKANRRCVGIWLDHREAKVVFVNDADEEVIHILSHVERHPRRSGLPATGPYEAQAVPADDSRERRYTGLLAGYLDRIIEAVEGADEIWIVGPGEAKGELRSRLDRTVRRGRSVFVESASRMSDGQLVHKVHQHFRGLPSRRQGPETAHHREPRK